MTPKDRGQRQSVVDESVVAALTGGNGGVVDALVRQQIRAEQEAERETPVTPCERRRRRRQLPVTFSDENQGVPERLRQLALKWGLLGPDGKRPNVSAVVEYLLLPRLEAAEAGQIPRHPDARVRDSWT